MPLQPSYPIESVDRALTLLSLFKNRHAIKLVEAAETLGVAKSTAHRLLAMLQMHGFVEQDVLTRVYHVGRGLIEIGLAAGGGLDVRPILRPHLEALVSEVDETAHLVTLRSKEILFLDGVESSKPLRAADRSGTSLAAHTTAGGKALLAEMKDDALLKLFPDERLLRPTAHTVRNRKALFEELREIRKSGYATNNQGSEPDISAYSRVVVGQTKTVRFALVVSGPTKRLLAAGMRDIIPALSRAASSAGASIL